MPLIDPGIVATSPYLADDFIVSRAAESISAFGRAEVTYTHLPKCFGIVTSAKRGDLERLPEGQRAQNVISVITRTELRGPTPGNQPDVITWAGTSYLVIKVDPYPRFGQGWYKALAASQNMIDLMPEACDGN